MIPAMIVMMGNFSAAATSNTADADYVGLREGFTQLARLIDTYNTIKVWCWGALWCSCMCLCPPQTNGMLHSCTLLGKQSHWSGKQALDADITRINDPCCCPAMCFLAVSCAGAQSLCVCPRAQRPRLGPHAAAACTANLLYRGAAGSAAQRSVCNKPVQVCRMIVLLGNGGISDSHSKVCLI